MIKRIEDMPVARTTAEFLARVKEVIDSHWLLEELCSLQDFMGNPFPRDGTESEKISVRWYRGQFGNWGLIPKVYRKQYHEQELLLEARRKAFHMADAPQQIDDYGAWMFLMQHHSLPTRLLDWTEGCAIALFFAVQHWRSFEDSKNWDSFSPEVWVLNPHVMNWIGLGCSFLPGTAPDEAAYDGTKKIMGYGQRNIYAAFDHTIEEHPTSIAVSTTYVHVRMQVQRSRFTVHGKDKGCIFEYYKRTNLVKKGFLFKIKIDKDKAESIVAELIDLGVSHSTLFPDLEGVSKELSEKHQ